MTLRVYYSDAYTCADTSLLQRLATSAAAIKQLNNVDFYRPSSFEASMLRGLHSEEYLTAFLNGVEPLASSQGIPWTPGIRDASLAMLGGQIEGAEHALEHGISMNLARGFHHAVHQRGSGYCPLNGLALVAHALPKKRVLVIDCDEHGGNGTEEFSERLPNLFNLSIFGTRFGCMGGKRSWAYKVCAKTDNFEGYLSALQVAERLIQDIQPDIIIYQAGADCHENDPKSLALLSTGQMYSRDSYVFSLAKDSGIPIMFVVAGGYQHPAKIAELNTNTVRAALACYFPNQN